MPDRDGAERSGVIATELSGDAVGEAIALLDAAEAAAGSPLVDEAERERLGAAARGTSERDPRWRSLLARRDAVAVGYAGVVVPDPGGEPAPQRLPDRPLETTEPEADRAATADLAVTRDLGPSGPVLAALLAGVEAFATHHGAPSLRVWLRHAAPDDLAHVSDLGYHVDRRLEVLGRSLAGAPLPSVDAAGYVVRSYRPHLDDAAVVEVLREAYTGTADGGWDLATFRERRGWSWFRPQDLLVAEDPDGRLGGLHWLKRRGPGVGEVYNLAVRPAAQGHGLGRALLAAGLEHLRRFGCNEVLLWVDTANLPAVGLYTSHGFTGRWEDVALLRTLPA